MMDLAQQEIAERLLAMGKALLDTVPVDVELGDERVAPWEAHRDSWMAQFGEAFSYLGAYDLDQPGARA